MSLSRTKEKRRLVRISSLEDDSPAPASRQGRSSKLDTGFRKSYFSAQSKTQYGILVFLAILVLALTTTALEMYRSKVRLEDVLERSSKAISLVADMKHNVILMHRSVRDALSESKSYGLDQNYWSNSVLRGSTAGILKSLESSIGEPIARTKLLAIADLLTKDIALQDRVLKHLGNVRKSGLTTSLELEIADTEQRLLLGLGEMTHVFSAETLEATNRLNEAYRSALTLVIVSAVSLMLLVAWCIVQRRSSSEPVKGNVPCLKPEESDSRFSGEPFVLRP